VTLYFIAVGRVNIRQKCRISLHISPYPFNIPISNCRWICFQPDNIEILIKGTPEERAVVINTGCVAFQALIQKRNEISKDNDYKEGKEEGLKS
jgi:hypothetical protein